MCGVCAYTPKHELRERFLGPERADETVRAEPLSLEKSFVFGKVILPARFGQADWMATVLHASETQSDRIEQERAVNEAETID